MAVYSFNGLAAQIRHGVQGFQVGEAVRILGLELQTCGRSKVIFAEHVPLIVAELRRQGRLAEDAVVKIPGVAELSPA